MLPWKGAVSLSLNKWVTVGSTAGREMCICRGHGGRQPSPGSSTSRAKWYTLGLLLVGKHTDGKTIL